VADRRLSRAEDGLASDRPLAVREWGAPDAPPLVFWPGLNPSAPWQLLEAGPLWAERFGLRVLAVSPPGWETPPLRFDEYRPTALARRVVALLDLLELNRVAYVGFSWGASIGVHLAGLSPERLTALVLLDAGYTDFQDIPDFEEQDPAEMTETIRKQGRFTSWDEYLEAMRARTRTWRPALEQRVRAAAEERDGAVVVRVPPEPVVAAAEGVVRERPSAALDALRHANVPVLVVAASQTIEEEWALAALARFRTAVPGAEIRTVDSGHDVLADAPGESIPLVGEWLNAVTISRA
jgi:lipase